MQVASPTTLRVISVPPKSPLDTSAGPFPNHVWIISLSLGYRCWGHSDPQIMQWQGKKITNTSWLFLWSKPIACPSTFGKFQEEIPTSKSVSTHITRILYFDKHSKKNYQPLLEKYSLFTFSIFIIWFWIDGLYLSHSISSNKNDLFPIYVCLLRVWTLPCMCYPFMMFVNPMESDYLLLYLLLKFIFQFGDSLLTAQYLSWFEIFFQK